MKTFFKSSPILAFILIAFAITFFFWFLPVMINLPKDIAFAGIIIGSCGPLLAGYVLTVLNSDARFAIGSKPIFVITLIGIGIVLFFRLFLTGNGMADINGKIPSLGEVGLFGYVMLAIAIFILALNISNGLNGILKENYLKSFFYKLSRTKWYLFAFLFLPVISLLSFYLGGSIGMETSASAINFETVWLVGFFSTFFFFGGNEEFGWRGFLQKELQKKYNPLIAVFVISFLWSLWHLPLHYNGFYGTGGFLEMLPRFIWTIPLTIVFTWAYNKSRYSVLTVVILHAMVNNNGKLFGSSELLYLILALAFCIFCIIDDKMWKRKAYHDVYLNEG
ncbi:CPBP family intramembrane metalloprotease [Flavobacteriaceae bacterium D16]|nr:CPBP family intramembrane metalloprotease [Flavobacteriaceae bacterium D16]